MSYWQRALLSAVLGVVCVLAAIPVNDAWSAFGLAIGVANIFAAVILLRRYTPGER